MKYWLLTSEYPPYYGGGIGTYTYHLAQLLGDKKVEVTVFVPDRNTNPINEETNNQVRVVRFSPYYADTASLLGYEAMVSYSCAAVIEKYMETEGLPDWLESQEYNGIAYYLLQKKHLGYNLFKDLKVVVTCHCPSFILHPYNHNSAFSLPGYWIGEMEKFCIESADICFSPSHYLVNSLVKAGIMRTDIRVLPNPYQPQEPVAETSSLPGSIIFIGKVSPAKGILELLDAIRVLRNQMPHIQLNIIGDANFYLHSRKKLMSVYLKEKYPDLFDAGTVIIKGVLPAMETAQYIKQASLLVLPSKMENLPYVVLESMYLGTPVLASVNGGQVEIIDNGKNGFLYNPIEKNVLAQKIQAILSMDSEAITAIKREGTKRIQDEYNPVKHYERKMEQLAGFNNPALHTFPFPGIIKSEKAPPPVPQEGQPLLSVIIPFYNLGKYVQETITSIQAADYKNIEIIIVDDGSADPDSLQVLDKLATLPNLSIITQPNQGLANARNKGAMAARGQFISFLDADDKVETAYYSKAVKVLMEKENVHFVGCWIKYFEGSDKGWASFTPVFPYILFHNMINSSSLVYKKNSFCKHGLNDDRFIYGMEDYDSVISMMAGGYYGVVLPELLFHYRVRKNSMSRGFNDTNQQYLYELIAEKHATTIAAFAPQLYSLLNANGPGYKIENPTRSSVSYSTNGYINTVTKKLVEKAKRSPKIRSVMLKIMSKRG
jgi:glycosyltransferase involved in cell wall biosynthesis